LRKRGIGSFDLTDGFFSRVLASLRLDISRGISVNRHSLLVSYLSALLYLNSILSLFPWEARTFESFFFRGYLLVLTHVSESSFPNSRVALSPTIFQVFCSTSFLGSFNCSLCSSCCLPPFKGGYTDFLSPVLFFLTECRRQSLSAFLGHSKFSSLAGACSPFSHTLHSFTEPFSSLFPESGPSIPPPPPYPE